MVVLDQHGIARRCRRVERDLTRNMAGEVNQSRHLQAKPDVTAE